jgi:hypothetical protein
MHLNKNTIIAIAAGAVLLAAAAYLLFMKSDSTVALTESLPQSTAEITFVNLASQLEPLGFDTSVLSDPRFMSLIDIHTAIIPESVGHADPFSPR